ncbi:MAG: type II secretion system protein [Deltaproteobacteria bacterium]|nr:type II secretion system protein [Deltaproteobacteria bacterium]
MTKLKVTSEKGFTLIEIAIVMVIIGLLAGGGVSLMGMLSERKIRNENADYLNEAKFALISYAKIHGKLPWADNTNGDGWENNLLATGELPYLTLGMKPRDANSRVIGYALNSNLGTSRSNSCSALRAGLAGSPLVVDSDGSTTAFSVAAVLVSAGPKDADNDGNVFDDVTAGTHRGDNRDGAPNFIRRPPDNTFDDLVVYISGYPLYGEICGNPVLSVNNGSAANIFVYNITQSSDIGLVAPGSAVSFRIISGEQFSIRSAASGGGAIVASNPNTPITIAGEGTLISVP